MVSFTTLSEALAAYGQWLPSQPLSTHTRRAYLIQVKQYCTYLSTFPWENGHPLQEAYARDYAVRDYKTALKVLHLAKPSSVNLALAAVDHFYRFLELPTPQVTREDLPTQAPRALEPAEQKRFLANIIDRPNSRLYASGRIRGRICNAVTDNCIVTPNDRTSGSGRPTQHPRRTRLRAKKRGWHNLMMRRLGSGFTPSQSQALCGDSVNRQR